MLITNGTLVFKNPQEFDAIVNLGCSITNSNIEFETGSYEDTENYKQYHLCTLEINNNMNDSYLASKWEDSESCKITHYPNGKIGWEVKKEPDQDTMVVIIKDVEII